MEYRDSANTLSAFIANGDALRAICSEIDSNIGSLIPQPILIIGEEGSGKTTLLNRLRIKYSNLHFIWIDGRFIFGSSDIIEKASEASILIIDNIDYFFNRCSYEEQYRLRKYLYSEGAPMMIASVSKLMPAITEYKAPFFEGLKKIHLAPITIEEIKSLFNEKLINRITLLYNLLSPTIKSLIIISQIIKSNKDSNKDIKLLLNYYSAICKKIYIDVPIKSQQILNILGESPTGITIKEIRAISGIPSGILTSYLKNLRKQDIISVDKGVKRNTKYSIKDPLFRIWLKNESLQYNLIGEIGKK